MMIPFRQKFILIIFGLLLTLIVIEAGLRLGGFIFSSLQERRNRISISKKDSYRIMCLGDSTTAVGGSYSYPSQLEKVLNERNIGIKFSVINKGIVGSGSLAIVTQLQGNLNKYRPHMVIIMMGANDGSQHLPYREVVAFRTGPFFRDFRTYKLAKLLWLHIVVKFEERGTYKPKANKELANLPRPEVLFKEPLEFNSKDDRAYIELGQIYRNQAKYSQAEEAFKKAIELNPGNDEAYLSLGRLYVQRNNRTQAEEAFKKAIELNPGDDIAYLSLGSLYLEENNRPQAEELFKKAIELNPENDKLYAGLAIAYNDIDLYEVAQAYYNKANELRLNYYNPVTRHNYLTIKEILDKKGIKMVCVQYPVRSVKSLKKLFEEQAGVIFVDNERVFKEALSKASYKEYFIDMFGGDFGHCTHKGNRILAENVANVILKEVFGK